MIGARGGAGTVKRWKIPIAVKVTIAGRAARAAIECTWDGWEANFIIEGREDAYWRLPLSWRPKQEGGAVLVEFAVLLPVLLIVAMGIFDVGVAMLNAMRLTFTTQAVAVAEVNNPGSGQAWGAKQLPDASFNIYAADCGGSNGIEVDSMMPNYAMMIPLPSLSAQACWPQPPKPPGA
jgi:hypothetical protein